MAFIAREKAGCIQRARCCAQHGVGLPAMMHLVLEQVEQQSVHPLVLNVGAAVYGNRARQPGPV